MGNSDWNCPLTYHSKIQRLCRCRASHSVILSLSHQVKTNTRFARACFPADVPNYAIFSHLSTALHLPGFCHLPSEDSVLHDRFPRVLLRSPYLRNRFPSSSVNFRSFLDFRTDSHAKTPIESVCQSSFSELPHE